MKYLQYKTYRNSSDKPKKAVFFLHGYGSNGDDLISLAPELSNCYEDVVFISPHAIEMFEGGMRDAYQWFSLQSREEGPMFKGVSSAFEVFKNFLQFELDKMGLKYKDVVLVGFSQGAMLALHTSLMLEEKIAGVIGFSGMLIAPHFFTEETIKSKTNTLLVHGEIDDVLPYKLSVLANKKLNSLGVKSDLHIQPKLGHGIDYQGIKLANKFLKEVFSDKGV